MSCIIKGLFTCAFFSLSCSAHAWWDQGHQLVAEIAQDATDANHMPFLSSQSKISIQTLLQIPIEHPGSVKLSQNTNTMTKSASWADSIKSYQNQDERYAECHYSGIPVKDLNYQISPVESISHVIQFYSTNMKTYNSISCLKSAIKTLTKQETTETEKAISLRMITHLIGDLSQPLHSGEHDTDRGGNDLILKNGIKIFSTTHKQALATSMHALWDSTLGHFPQYNYNSNEVKNGIFSDTDVNSVKQESHEMVMKPDLRALPVNFYETSNVSVLHWVAEAHLTAQNIVYYNIPLTGEKTPHGLPFVDISENTPYFQNSISAVEPIIYESGVHLAKLLTAIFDPNHAEVGYVNFVNEVAFDPEISTFPPR